MRKFTKLFLTALLLLSVINSSQAQGNVVASQLAIKEQIVRHSIKYGVDPALSLSVARQESNFNKNAVSRNGAVGIFQLMPSTAKALGINPYYMNENIIGGVKYLKGLQDKFGSVELVIAAYNAGPNAVQAHKGVPPYRETQSYVRKIVTHYNYLKVNPDPIMLKVQKEYKVKGYSKELAAANSGKKTAPPSIMNSKSPLIDSINKTKIQNKS